MSHSPRKHGEHPVTKEEPAGWPQSAAEMWHPVADAMQAWSAQYSAMTAASLEWSRFLSRRLQEDFELPLRLATSRCPEEYWKHCTDFWQKLAADYRDEFETLAELGTAQARAGYGAHGNRSDQSVRSGGVTAARH